MTISATNGGGTGSATLVIFIAAKQVTLSVASASLKVYDATTIAQVSGASISGVVSGDIVNVSAIGVFNDKTVGTAKTVIISYSLNGADASKYVLDTTSSTSNADIIPATLTVSGVSVSTRGYNGLTNATITGANLSGVFLQDIVSVSGNGTFDSANAGSGIPVTTVLSLSGADATNYTLTQPTSLTGTITPTVLTILGVTVNNKTYDGNTNATLSGTPTLFGVVSGDALTVGGTPLATFSQSNVGSGLAVTVTGYILNGISSGNYTLTQPNLIGNITGVALTINGITANNKVYDGTNTSTLSGTATLVGVASGDNVTLSGSPSASFSQSNVGSGLTVTVTGYILNGTSAGNYSLTQPTGLIADISPKALTITANNVSKDPAQVLTSASSSTAFTSNGLIGAQTIGSVTITYNSSSNSAAGATGNGNTIGTYTNQVIPSAATGGTFTASNYTISYVSGNIVVSGFTKGNLVVNRFGDGTTSLGSIAAPISLIEVTTTGTIVNTLNTGVFTGTNLLTDTGSGTSNGNLSTYGQYLAVPGYNTTVGTTGVASLNTKATNIFGLGYNLANRVTFPTTVYPSNNFRSIVPTSASTFYTAGTPGGIWYYDGSNFVNVCTLVSNTRVVKIFNGNLYFTTATSAGIYQVGTGLPTTTGQTATLLFNTVTSSPYGFSISPDGNTAYVADDSAVSGNTGGGIQKWSKATGTWVRQYTLGTIARSITVDFSNTNPIIYATTAETSNNKVIKVMDNGSALISTDVISAGANYIFRGIDFTPSAPSPKITASGSVAACNTTYGTASSITSFNVAGTNMLGSITITPPIGFEVSTTSDFSSNVGTNTSPITTSNSTTIASTTIYVRIPATTAAGTYSGNIILSSSFANNLNVATATSIVGTKALTITGVIGNSKTYDGTTSATLSGNAAYSGLVNGDNFTSVTGTPIAVFNNKNIGSAKTITITGYTAPSSNYTILQPTTSADITAKDLTITNINANDKVYDGNYSASVTATLNGVVSPDNVTLLSSGVFTDGPYIGNFGVTVTFSLNGTDSTNYNLVQPNTSSLTANITPKALTIFNPIAINKVYDGTTAAVVSGTLIGVVSTTSEVVTLNGSYGTFASPEIGTNILVTPTWMIDGDTYNYILVQPTTILTANITSPGSPSITSALVASANYGAASTSYSIATNISTTSYSASGLPNGLSINTATGEITGTPTTAGTFNVTLGATGIGGTGYATLVYTISPILLTVSGASANNKPYDGTTNATINGTLVGVINSDDVTLNGVGTFDSAFVASNIGVTSNATLTGAQASNYILENPTGLVASITPKALTVSVIVADKVYDRTNLATVTITSINGVVGSEEVTASITGTFDTVNAGNNKPVTITSLTIGGANAANYSLVNPIVVTGNIIPKPITFTATADNKVFDGTTNSTITISAITGVIAPDIVTITGIGTFASSSIANGILVNNITLSLGGAQASNYSIIQPTGSLTANITVAPTDLVAGDIAVIGYNTSGTPDSFAILVLKDLTSGTKFYVNDNELASTTATSFTDLAEMEASFTVKSGQTVPAGTVIVLPWGAAAVSTSTYDWSSTSGAGLGASNDEIYIYTAPSITATTPTSFIYFAKIGSSPSSIPVTLETSTIGAGTTAINPSAAALRYNTTTNIYNSCKQILLNEIGKTTTANWITTGAAALAASDWTFTVLATCPSPTINVSGILTGLTTVYGSASIASTSFSVAGSYLNSSIVITAPTGFEISTSQSSGFAGSLTLNPISGAVASTIIYVRLSATSTVISSPYSGDVVCSSSGATSINVPIASSIVTPKTVTISGVLVNNKIQTNGDFTATLTGTPVLNGVLNLDVANVTLGGTPIANFTQDTAGANIPVIVSGYILTGSASGNYILVQPSLTGTITSVASPVITSALTYSSVYGTIAPIYAITASTDSSYPITVYNATGLPTGLTVDSSTGLISGTPTATPGTYTVTISATNVGGTTNAYLIYSITAKALTVSGATASSKVYNGTTSAIILGYSLNGIYGSDVVTASGTGLFSDKNVGTGKSVTATMTLSGTDATKYTLIQPTGLTADITPLTLTLSGVLAQNKVVDGTNIATINATLVGVISGDLVTFNGTGTFATSNVGQGIAVTSTATLSGTDAGNYTFVQPTGLTANITDKVLYYNSFTGVSACPTNGNIPTMATNSTGTPVTRSTVTCNATANVFNSTTINTTSSLNPASYIEFSVSAAAGYQLNLKSLSFFRQASNSAPNKMEVRYSNDNFATYNTWGAAPNTPTTGTVATWDFADFSTTLSNTVTFRIYPYGTQRADNTITASSTTGTFRVDDVTVYGTATSVVPNTTNLKFNIEGYYNTVSQSMVPVKANQYVGTSTTDVDDVTIELRTANGTLVDTAIAALKTNGTAVASFPTGASGSYYLVIKYKNAIETWSATPQLVGLTPLTYDFTNAASKAYGNNMKQVSPGVFAIYSGDINQDSNVDNLDYSAWEEDANNLMSGYFATDLNGDGNVDNLDYSIWETNSNNFVYSITPF